MYGKLIQDISIGDVRNKHDAFLLEEYGYLRRLREVRLQCDSVNRLVDCFGCDTGDRDFTQVVRDEGVRRVRGLWKKFILVIRI